MKDAKYDAKLLNFFKKLQRIIPAFNSPILRWVRLNITQCNDHRPINNMVCAGSGRKGICVGDSGGPLIAPKSDSDDTAVVIGIASDYQGYTCRGTGPYSIFARVGSQIDWIKTNLG